LSGQMPNIVALALGEAPAAAAYRNLTDDTGE
jgi:hypothetical protein